ncbi:MAG: hypothetical protein F4092_11795 [Rhodospirillaceae bacterium]|nr:hypothetical protein [Rhodospirillaceae bacterium]
MVRQCRNSLVHAGFRYAYVSARHSQATHGTGPGGHGSIDCRGARRRFYLAGPEEIYLLTAYAKSDRDDLTPADAKALSRLVATIRKEAGKR